MQQEIVEIPPNNKQIAALNRAIKHSIEAFKPPENFTLSEWADRYRMLSSESSAEVGHWRTSRTPYLKRPMDCFTDPKVTDVVMITSSQIGKSEFILNAIGYVIDQAPGSIMFVQPTIPEARKFSNQRIAPMIRDTPRLAAKLDYSKSKKSTNTILQKAFPGGLLTITGSNVASALASVPSKYVFGDEIDRWALSAGREGDPWTVVKARQATFYNPKRIRVSSPVIKGESKIEDAFYTGTQEVWCHKCPDCGEFSQIVFENIKFNFEKTKSKNGKATYTIKDCYWACPHCGGAYTQDIMRQQPQQWIASNPEAYEEGIVSFKINSFSSPWKMWTTICKEFLEAKDDPEKLKPFFNTVLGEAWEDREKVEEPEILYNRREHYNAELPDGVLAITMGVDTQDNRLEYEVVGYGKYGETWGLKKGFIMGVPERDSDVWQKLEGIITHEYQYENGKKLRTSITFIDSGGHYTQEVYQFCYNHRHLGVFPIKGSGGEGIAFTMPPSKIYLLDKYRRKTQKKVNLYNLGVDAGKSRIANAIKVQESGPKYCHYPNNENLGYGMEYFEGLLSENLQLTAGKNGQKKWAWVKVTSARNESLDCRNYANAAFDVLNPNLDYIESILKGQNQPKAQPPKRKTRTKKNSLLEEW